MDLVDPEAQALGWTPQRQASSTAELLGAVRGFVGAYCVLDDTQKDAIALWVLHAHALDAFDETGYLVVVSPEKRCGKTTLLQTLELVTPRAWRVAGVSEAVVFRKIERDKPTLLLDETDAVFGPGREHEGLRALLNAGNVRGATVARCVGQRHELADFEIFCAKVLAGIGEQHLPDTIRDRAITIVMRRRHRGEPIARFRRRAATAAAASIRAALERWPTDVMGTLRDARPKVPDELDDRAADIWEPLLAIADLAGEDWPTRARDAAVSLRGRRAEPESTGVELLRSIKDVFEATDRDRILTTDLLRGLASDQEGAFADWWNPTIDAPSQGAQRRLARVLREFGITSTSLRVDSRAGRGYRREDFADAWSRYTRAGPAEIRDIRDIRDTQSRSSAQNPLDVTDVTDVTLTATDPDATSHARGVANDQKRRFADAIKAGHSLAEAATRAGYDPGRIPVTHAVDAPEILAGAEPEFYERMEKEGRVPPGTADIARRLESGSGS